MSTEAFTVRTDADVVQQLDQIADSLDQSRNYLVNQAIKEYLQHHAWQFEKTSQGIIAADRGELIEHSQLMKEIEDLLDVKTKNKA